MKTNDYIKFLTQQFVKYMAVPKAERKQQREDKKKAKEPYVSNWFGVIPFAFMMLLKRK
ncbi:YqzE family protein [Bacillus sp. V5-8f]|uniref:YqzE family protein n=1 Tax=Bacillus sp. V5-8f TaxID=2053044 RepID=UPI000C763831|nr:YqzE family protein [Bacillus sp. V5-8f]PLT34729.1 YqzE family protein [Bacillus sp. V5-8f]